MNMMLRRYHKKKVDAPIVYTFEQLDAKTIPEIKAILDDANIEYKSRHGKPDLINLVLGEPLEDGEPQGEGIIKDPPQTKVGETNGVDTNNV